MAGGDPTAYESDVATTLNNLGSLYGNLRNFKKADDLPDICKALVIFLTRKETVLIKEPEN